MFRNAEEAKAIIRTRTSKIIGGYISEQLFAEVYAKKYRDRLYSKGWWGGIEFSYQKTMTFFVVKNELNELDRKVIERLESQGYLWKQLVCQEDGWYVQDYHEKLTLDSYIKARGLNQKQHSREIHAPTGYDRNLERCIATYEKQGRLEEIASSIYIEDHFLNKYYIISNIDFICEDADGNPIYAEVKFKNPFQIKYGDKYRMVFGIDEFQYNILFQPFFKAGIKVANVLLVNDIKREDNKESTAIFDFLDQKQGKKMLWKYKFLDPDEKLTSISTDRGYTGWRGKVKRTIYCVPIQEYRDFEHYTLPSTCKKYYPDGAWGYCEICGSPLVLRRMSGNTSEFFGCLNYTRHPKNKE